MDLHVQLWICGSVCLLCGFVSVLSEESLPECKRDSDSSRMEWRSQKETSQLHLNMTNIGCRLGEQCANQTEAAEIATVISLVIQSGDEIELFVDTDDVDGGHVIVRNRSEANLRCDRHPNQTTLMTSSTRNFTLRDNVLPPGGRMLFVELVPDNSTCTYLWSLQVKVEEHDCSRNKEHSLCSDRGFCDNFSNTGSFSCRCCAGFVGRWCEERDGCHGNPCRHGGFCVDIAEGLHGHTYQCLCPHGFRGRSCDSPVSPCDRRPCLHNSTCVSLSTSNATATGNATATSTATGYRCECVRGFSGADCSEDVNECLSNPCVHGVCEDAPGGYNCYCLPGYGGEHCEFEYDECDSSPCINGGACEDLVAGYRCHCGPGFEGRRCQVKVDLCRPNPCPPPAHCLDRGNNYSCICHPGYNGPGCTQHYDPCYPNPCQNGGSCWPSLDSYYCSCSPGFTGDICEESMVAAQPLPRTLEDPGEPEEGHSLPSTTGGSDDRWHSLYLVGTMLSVAAVAVVSVAVGCHCRLHKTYQRFTRHVGRQCSEIKQQKLEEDRGKFSLNLRGSVSEIPKEPPYEATSVDVGLSDPLIC